MILNWISESKNQGCNHRRSAINRVLPRPHFVPHLISPNFCLCPTNMSELFLSPDGPNQTYITLSALTAGWLWLPENHFIDPCDEKAIHKAPSLSFFLVHPSGTKIVYDLGLRRDWENYPPALVERIRGGTRKIDVSQDVRDSVVKGGIDPKDVDVVIVSHIHYDHTGNPSQFPNAKYHIGPGSLELIEESSKTIKDPSENWFTDALLPANTSLIHQFPPYTSSEWKAIGPFARTLDYFKDGSFYLVDSTGHLPGHINGLVRIGPNRFVYLASDSCHFTSILSGECGIAFFKDDKGVLKTVHSDKDAAEAHIKRIRELRDRGGNNVEIVLAHELGWEDKHGSRFLPGKFE
jgi:glyoxylase-like metal-dependent hydrolase (beta-lactamase superfamily II)